MGENDLKRLGNVSIMVKESVPDHDSFFNRVFHFLQNLLASLLPRKLQQCSL